MVRKALGTFCPAVSLIQTWHDMPPFPPASPGKWVATGSAPTLLAPYTSGYKLALLVNYSIMLCKCFLINYTFLGLKLHFAWFPFHCTSPRSDPSTPIALEININGFRCLLLWYGPLFGQSPWSFPLALPLCFFFLSYDDSVLWVQNVDYMFRNDIHAIYNYKTKSRLYSVILAYELLFLSYTCSEVICLVLWSLDSDAMKT